MSSSSSSATAADPDFAGPVLLASLLELGSSSAKSSSSSEVSLSCRRLNCLDREGRRTLIDTVDTMSVFALGLRCNEQTCSPEWDIHPTQQLTVIFETPPPEELAPSAWATWSSNDSSWSSVTLPRSWPDLAILTSSSCRLRALSGRTNAILDTVGDAVDWRGWRASVRSSSIYPPIHLRRADDSLPQSPHAHRSRACGSRICDMTALLDSSSSAACCAAACRG